MATFDYCAIDPQGKQKTGILEADSERQVRQQLRQLNLVPLSVTPSSNRDKAAKYRTRLGPTNLAIITRQLAVLLRSGMTLSEALNGIAKQAGTKSTNPNAAGRVITIVRSSVQEGSTLSDSLQQFPKSFDQLYCATVKAGENTGHLDTVLEQLADHTESQREFRQKTTAALIYPILLVVMSIAIVSGLMIYIVPDVIKVFVDSGQRLPLLTRGLLASSDFLQQWGWLMAAIGGGSLVTVVMAMRQTAIKQKVHKLYLRLPIVRIFSRGLNAQRYMQTLGILSQSGVPLHQGMEIAQQVITNTHLSVLLSKVANRVKEGESLSNALDQMGYFPPLMIYMLASGEASGELDQMLIKSAQQQQQDIKAIVATAVSLFEPLMLLFMGGIVLIIVLAILLPILNMSQLIG
ncbi:type II secretion system inner membrane protein GspF [Porticoccaceae bacterium]|jgi:general secretion pathway protein F|nr:type II secretion system inner membrane protein GspF [Porticoccaceae bacterium]